MTRGKYYRLWKLNEYRRKYAELQLKYEANKKARARISERRRRALENERKYKNLYLKNRVKRRG